MRSPIAVLGFVAVAIGLLWPGTSWARGIGISPALLEVIGVGTNSTVQQFMYFSRGNPATDQQVRIDIAGPAAQYVTGAATMVLPAGQQITPYPITIDTTGLGEGVYDASITVTEVLAGGGTSTGSATAAAARAGISYSVTTAVTKAFEIKQAAVASTEEGQPVSITFVLNNTGNAAARPEEIQLTITEQATAKEVHKETISASALTPVTGLSQQEQTIATKATLPVGTYNARLAFLDGGAVIYQVDTSFQVLPVGSLKQGGQLETFAPNKESYELQEFAQLSGVFRNTGEVGVPTVFMVEVYDGDTQVALLTSESVFVAPERTQTFELPWHVPRAGSYRVKAYATYAGQRSNEILSTITVARAGWFWWLIIIVFVLFLGLLLLLLLLLLRRRRKDTEQKPLTPPPSVPSTV